MMSSSDKAQRISSVEALIGYDFTNKDLCLEALSTKVPLTRRLQGWIITGTPTHVGNSYANDIATNTSLMALGKARGLGTFMNLNPSLRGSVQGSQIADAVEALVGAVDCDGGDIDEKDGVMVALGLL
ncbi:putative ribonuclease 3 [Amylocarpus encephaloides]|uniref:Ribonuclease 3 n=1 Tax=Amylocarpus encephaloides TaxID=45428 RepID=A0A9P7YC55_9HELO|nr:putative ribonuclease 3 [Amylocarpus encephaloides]